MSAIVWDEIGSRSYEGGVSHGVLYKEDGYGIPWNGMTAVEETGFNSTESDYFDGVKFNDVVTIGDYVATLRAFTYPDEFLYFEGVFEDQPGFYVTQQEPNSFGLSYRTQIGDAVNGLEAGYKIHLVYNLTAVPTTKSYETISDDFEPSEFEWTITGVPEEIEGFRPTCHVIIDSRYIDPFLLEDLEGVLYGSEDNDPHLPSLRALGSYIRSWQRLIVTDNGDGTWTARTTVDGVLVMLDANTFELNTDTAAYLDADTYTIESTDKTEGDLWLP